MNTRQAESSRMNGCHQPDRKMLNYRQRECASLRPLLSGTFLDPIIMFPFWYMFPFLFIPFYGYIFDVDIFLIYPYPLSLLLRCGLLILISMMSYCLCSGLFIFHTLPRLYSTRFTPFLSPLFFHGPIYHFSLVTDSIVDDDVMTTPVYNRHSVAGVTPNFDISGSPLPFLTLV